MNRSIVKFLFFVPLLIAEAQTSSALHVDSFPFASETSPAVFQLTKNFIEQSTITITVDTVPVRTFSYDAKTNRISFSFDSGFSASGTVFISYRYLSFGLKPSYSLRSLVFKNDSSGSPAKRAIVTQSEGIFSNMFGPELSKSGSLTRGFLVGSNRDLTLSSGFRLQMAGKLSDEIDIIAALTDENTPIQPQGNTQTLQEIDNVFVEIKSPTYTATLGDFQFSSVNGEFVNINRKVQGARVLANFQSDAPQSRVYASAATTRGKYHSNQFQGSEGVQGPYRLTGKNNERAIIVIAGTEKVYVDGVVMQRGDNNDYSIEYGSAEVTFSTRRLITSASRITIDFEYSDRQFTRNFVGVGAENKLSNSFKLHFNYFREGDDPDAPIDVSLTEQDKEILRASGNSSATKSGVITVGTDSTGVGKGNYAGVDTVINGSAFRFYRFEQNTSGSIYNVAFSPVGPGNGDYVREGIGQYRFVGIGNGQYAPIIFLPTPQLHQLYSALFKSEPLSDFIIEGEYAASNFDENRFSSIDDDRNSGSAIKFSTRYSPKEMYVGGINLGSVDISISERYKESRFLAFDRSEPVEFGRKWSTDSLSPSSTYEEEIREGKIIYIPAEGIAVSSSVGFLDRTGLFSSSRYDGSVELKLKEYPTVTYYAENIRGNEKRSLLSNDWFRQKGATEYTFSGLTPAFSFMNERRTVFDARTNVLESSSYAFVSYTPKLSIMDIGGIDLSSEYEWREDEGVAQGSLIPQSNSFTQNYSVGVKEIDQFSFTGILTLREKTFQKEFQANNVNQQTTLVKLQSRYRPFSQGLDIDVFYDAATQRTASLTRVFFKVRRGEGQYVWNDVNANGVVDLDDENEFKPDRFDGEYIALTLNSDNLVPIVNVKASSRVRLIPSRFLKESTTLLSTVLKTISTETFFRIEERSTETDVKKIYLLDLGSFLDPVTTLAGTRFFQQDIFLFEYNPEYSFRIRFNQRNGLSRFSSGVEQNYSRERSVRARFQVSNDIANQTDVVQKNDNAISSSAINQPRQINSMLLTTDLSYRPETNVEIGIKFETSRAEDHSGTKLIPSDFNGQTIRLVYGLPGNGQIRSEFSREEILIGTLPAGYTAPYELTAGRDFGKNYLWSISSEYRMGGNVQFSLHYSGRTTARSSVVHTGRMEVRAFF